MPCIVPDAGVKLINKADPIPALLGRTALSSSTFYVPGGEQNHEIQPAWSLQPVATLVLSIYSVPDIVPNTQQTLSHLTFMICVR